MAREQRSRRVDLRQRKKQPEEEEKEPNPKQGKHVFTRFPHGNLDLDVKYTYSTPPPFPNPAIPPAFPAIQGFDCSVLDQRFLAWGVVWSDALCPSDAPTERGMHLISTTTEKKNPAQLPGAR